MIGGGAVVLSNQDGCCGGIAAEIGAKNMPPACFLNAPTCDSPSVTAYAATPPLTQGRLGAKRCPNWARGI
nr:MAG TPA: hypothetical protein [Caudoviricetes sp.]